jgi:hypothetical protein
MQVFQFSKALLLLSSRHIAAATMPRNEGFRIHSARQDKPVLALYAFCELR